MSKKKKKKIRKNLSGWAGAVAPHPPPHGQRLARIKNGKEEGKNKRREWPRCQTAVQTVLFAHEKEAAEAGWEVESPFINNPESLWLLEKGTLVVYRNRMSG